MSIAPGQRVELGRLPRFGTMLWRAAPSVPMAPTIEVRGDALTQSLLVPVPLPGDLERRRVTADFHCVSGWTVRDVTWEGVALADVWRALVEPSVRPGVSVTHLRFRGLDGVPATMLLEDAVADGVLLAERLEGRPLDADHGAPVRVVSPAQYGYMSIKHLCRVDVLCGPPPGPGWSLMDGLLIRRHPRARVAEEERNGVLPNAVVRPLYRLLRGPALAACARGADSAQTSAPGGVVGGPGS